MDELKKYIQTNIDELNIDEPGVRVWERISGDAKIVKEVKEVKRGGRFVLISRLAVAACMLVLAGVGILYLVRPVKTEQTSVVANQTITEKEKVPATIELKPTVPKQKQAMVIARNGHPKKTPLPIFHQYAPYISTEERTALQDLESSFTQVINMQRERIHAMPMYAETPEYFNDFKIQIRQMEKDEKGIKSDITKHGLNNEVLDQLINLYQQKLGILKQLQIEMNKTNNRFKQNTGPVDSTKIYFLTL